MSAKFPEKVVQMIQEGMNRYRPIIRQAKSENRNESNTAAIVRSMFEDIFGFDKFSDVTSEYLLKGQYADFALKIQNKPIAIVEVKSIGTILNEQHLFQAKSYAGELGVLWTILTNAAEWRLYRLILDQSVKTHLVAQVDMLGERLDTAEVGLFHRWSFQKGVAETLWNRQSALSDQNLVRALLSDEVLAGVGRWIRRETGLKVAVEELRSGLVTDVIRPGLVGSVSLSEVGNGSEPEKPAGTNRVRLSSMVKAGVLTVGEQLQGDSDGQTATALVTAQGLEIAGKACRNVYEAAEAAFGKSVSDPWNTWRKSSGETLGEARARFLSGD